MEVSFVVIAYNEQEEIGETLDGILGQEPLSGDIEVVVVDDGSTDGTRDIVSRASERDPRVRLHRMGGNRGRGAARAAGVRAATGRYLAFVDADIGLPAHWLRTCLAEIQTCDACCGTAIPDGDATWVYRTFGLTPKAVPATVAITGNNCLFRRSLFDDVSFSEEKANGEDVDLNYQLQDRGFVTRTIPGLVVEHREHKSYWKSLTWLFESGLGATEQLAEHHEVRMPDIAFFGFLVVVGASVIARRRRLGTAAVTGYIIASGAAHASTRFEVLENPARGTAASLATATLLLAYYAGRATGLARLATRCGRR